jgi:hypothetical protein
VVDLKRHDPHMARAVAAWLCRRHTEATLAELAEWLGLSRADSVPNLTRRFQARLKSQPELLNDVEEILRRATTVVADRRRTTLETPNAKRRLGHSKTKTNSDTAQRRKQSLTPRSAVTPRSAAFFVATSMANPKMSKIGTRDESPSSSSRKQ